MDDLIAAHQDLPPAVEKMIREIALKNTEIVGKILRLNLFYVSDVLMTTVMAREESLLVGVVE
jgi:hypothetical protein